MYMVHVRIVKISGIDVWKKVFYPHSDLILAGDLNFSLSTDEIWGSTVVIDPLASFFKDLFANTSLVDVAPSQLVPTWRNGRMGDSNISKHLDRFFVAEGFLGPVSRYRSWVGSSYISDHAPVFFQLDIGFPKTVYPFKFNPIWLEDSSFTALTREVWLDSRFTLLEDPQQRLVEKLALLKRRVKVWARQKMVIKQRTFDKSGK
jgi:hypothetical protein